MKLRQTGVAVSTACLALFSLPACAASHSQSKGAVTITVDIPPLSAAIRAHHEGAVGLWTVTNSSNGLMVKIPTVIGTKGTASVSIFGGQNTVFSAEAIGSFSPRITSIVQSRADGLQRSDIQLAIADEHSPKPLNGVYTFLIRAS